MVFNITGKGDIERLSMFEEGNFNSYELYIRVWEDKLHEKIKNLPKHIKISSIHNPTTVKIDDEIFGFDLSDPEKIGEESFRSLNHTIELAKNIQAKIVVIHGARYQSGKKEEAFQLLANRIKKTQCGEIELCFENDALWRNTYFQKKALIVFKEDFQKLDKLLDKKLKITIDVEHLHLSLYFNNFIESIGGEGKFEEKYPIKKIKEFELDIQKFIKENYPHLKEKIKECLASFFVDFRDKIKHIHLNGSDPFNFIFKDGKVPLAGEHLPLGFEGEEIKDRLNYYFIFELFHSLPPENKINIVIEAWRENPEEFISEMVKSKQFLTKYLNLPKRENDMVEICGKEIKNFGEPFIIAEIGSNHNGKIELAQQLIDKAVGAGADAVKFQAFGLNLFSEACYEGDPRRKALMEKSAALKHYFTEVHSELKREMSEYAASKELLREAKNYCDEKGIVFCCTPLDKKSVDFLVDELGMEFIKVASMDANNYPFLDYIARKQKPVILSTGMASFTEITEAVETITTAGNDQVVLLHCVSTYPPKDENINLNNLKLLRNNFDFLVGWSDHTLGISISLAAVAKGACIIEKHFTLDKDMPGWDHKVSATPEELKLLVGESKKIWKSLGSYHRVLPKDEVDKRALFRRSVVVTKDLPVGHTMTEEDIEFKRPGIGIEPKDAKFVIGRKLNKDLKSDDLIGFENLV